MVPGLSSRPATRENSPTQYPPSGRTGRWPSDSARRLGRAWSRCTRSSDTLTPSKGSTERRASLPPEATRPDSGRVADAAPLPLPVLLNVERAVIVALVADEAAPLRPTDDRLDHARVATQEDVEVLGRERQSCLLLNRTGGDDVLEVATPAAPGAVFLWTSNDGDVVEVATVAGQTGQLGAVAQVPRVASAMDHHEIALPVAFEVATEHRHVGRQTRPGADHEEVLAGGLVEREDADGLGPHIQPILDLQVEQPGRQLATHDEGQVELDVFVGAAFRGDRVGAPDHPLGVGGGLGDRGGLGVDGGLAFRRAGHGVLRGLTRRQDARCGLTLPLVYSRL